MKKVLFIIFLMIITGLNAQLVSVLERLSNSNRTTTRLDRLMEIPPDGKKLGVVQIEDAGIDKYSAYSQLYRIASTFGANAYSVDELDFDAENFKADLYYVSGPQNSPARLFIFSESDHERPVMVNNAKYTVTSSRPLELPLENGKAYDVSTGKFLGTRYKFVHEDGFGSKYYMLRGFNINDNNSGMLNIKSSDLTVMDASFAQFLFLFQNSHSKQ